MNTVALMASWSIFGAAAEWSRGKSEFTVEEMTNQVLVVIIEGVAQIIPAQSL